MPVMREIKTPFTFFKIRYFQDEKGIYYKKFGENHRKKVRPFWKMKRIVWGIPVMILLVLGVMGYKIGMNLVSDKVVDELASQITKEDYDKILKDPSIQQIIDKETVKNSELLKSVSSNPAIKNTVSNGQDTPVTVTTTENTSNEKKPATTTTNVDSGKDKDKDAATEDAATAVPEKGKTAPEQKPAVEQEKPGLHFNSRSEAMKFLLSKFSMSELSAFAKKAEGGVTPEEKAEIKSTVLGRLSAEEYNALKVFAVIEVSNRQ